MNFVYEILKESWYLYLDVAIYMLFGFFVAHPGGTSIGELSLGAWGSRMVNFAP